MTEFTPCVVCDPKLAERCKTLRGLVDRVRPKLTSREIAEGEDIAEYAHRLSAHLIAMRILEHVTDGCTEFISDSHALHGDTGTEALSGEL